MQLTMQEEQKQNETLSSLMDGELINDKFTDDRFLQTITEDERLHACWHRYHIARDAMQGNLHSCSLTLDIESAVAQSIANDNLYGVPATDQPAIANVEMPNLNSLKSPNLFWAHLKEMAIRTSQVGLAACVTLAIIAGVQYHQGQSNDSHAPILNTVPIGVNVAPVGGIAQPGEQQPSEQQLFEKRQYDKIRLLVQDYELQKRLNTH
ncbi:RseA family anti-sigma factor [Orbaceae bacterium ESL0727]|nr:RseA family anti-sigma factor [Orbaceae bacterium ESL0727]